MKICLSDRKVIKKSIIMWGGKFMEYGGWPSWQVFTLIFCIATALAIAISTRNKNKKDK